MGEHDLIVFVSGKKNTQAKDAGQKDNQKNTKRHGQPEPTLADIQAKQSHTAR